jgi:inorganic pyrophosphatase
MDTNNLMNTNNLMDTKNLIDNEKLINNEKLLNKIDAIDVYIEISKNTNIKYEFDFELECLRCDRVLSTPFIFPFNYGFIPNTLSGDNDPIDAIVYMEYPLISGSTISCRIIGGLETVDDKGEDTKLILCPMPKVSPADAHIKTINDLPPNFITNIIYFYQHYKDLEGKQVTIGKLLSVDEAIQKYKESQLHSRYLSY